MCQDSPQSDTAAWRAVRQRTGAKLPPDEGNHCGSRGAFLISYLHWLFIQSHIIRSLPPSLSKYLGEVSCRSTHRCIRLLQVHRALWECFLRSGIGIHWWWVLRKTSLDFTTTDEIPRSQELGFVVTDVHDKSYLIGVKEAPFPIVNITTKVDDETNISEVKVTFQRQKSLIPCSV